MDKQSSAIQNFAQMGCNMLRLRSVILSIYGLVTLVTVANAQAPDVGALKTNLKNIPYKELAIRGTEIANDIAAAKGNVTKPLLPPPANLNEAQAKLLNRLSDRRFDLVGIEQDLQKNQTNIRLTLDALGLASGTLVAQPLAGLGLGETVNAYIEQRTIQPLLEQARNAYRQDVARLVVQSFKQDGDIAKLKAAAKSGADPKILEGLADVAWTNRVSMLDVNFLEFFPEAEREAIFKQGVKSLLSFSRTENALKFLDLKKDTTQLKKGISEVREILSSIEKKQTQGFEDLQITLQNNQQELKGIKTQLDQQVSDSRFLQDNLYWNQLGPSQKAEALRRGWLADKFKEPQDRVDEITRLERIAKFNNVASKFENANEFLAGMSSVAGILNLPDETKKAIANAQKNIKTAQSVVNIAGSIATGNYFGALTAAGGLFGGDSSDPATAQHQALMQRLDMIDAKLDQILRLQKETLAALANLHSDLTKFAVDTDKRLGSIDLQLLGLRDKIQVGLLNQDGLSECESIKSQLLPSNGDNPWKFDKNTNGFQSYNSRRGFFDQLTMPETFLKCGGFLHKALLSQRPHILSEFVLARLADTDIDAIIAQPEKAALHQAAWSAKNSQRTNIYWSMRDYHLENLKVAPGSRNDFALFAVQANTPLNFHKVRLSEWLAVDAKSLLQHKFQGRIAEYGSFNWATERQIDLHQLQQMKFFLDIYSGFALLQEASGKRLRAPSRIEIRNEVAVTKILGLYGSFKNVLAIASVQQAMLSGAAVAHVALNDLRAMRFGRPLNTCWTNETHNGLTPSEIAMCSVVAAWKNHSLKSAAEAAVSVRNELLAKVDNDQGVLFRAIDRLNKKNCARIPLDDPSAASQELAILSRYSEFWRYAITECLLQNNPIFMRNVVLYSVLSSLKAESMGLPEYVAATSMATTFISRSVIGDLPFSPIDSSTSWSFTLYSPFGVRNEWVIPLPSSIASGMTLDTEAGKFLTRMRNAVESELLELRLCSTGSDPACTDQNRALLAQIVEFRRAANAQSSN